MSCCISSLTACVSSSTLPSRGSCSVSLEESIMREGQSTSSQPTSLPSFVIPIKINSIVKSVTWLVTFLSHSDSLRFLQIVDNIIQVVILTFIFMFIFDMMSVRAFLESQNSMENMKRQISLARMKYGFIIIYWVVVSALIFIFYSAYLREFKYKSF